MKPMTVVVAVMALAVLCIGVGVVSFSMGKTKTMSDQRVAYHPSAEAQPAASGSGISNAILSMTDAEADALEGMTEEEIDAEQRRLHGGGYGDDGFDGGENSGEEAIMPYFDPVSLGGIYRITFSPDDSKRKAETYKFILNIQPPSGTSIAFDGSLVDGDGSSWPVKSGFAKFNTATQNMAFEMNISILGLEVYVLNGVVQSNGSMSGTYKQTFHYDSPGVSYTGTFIGEKTF